MVIPLAVTLKLIGMHSNEREQVCFEHKILRALMEEQMQEECFEAHKKATELQDPTRETTKHDAAANAVLDKLAKSIEEVHKENIPKDHNGWANNVLGRIRDLPAEVKKSRRKVRRVRRTNSNSFSHIEGRAVEHPRRRVKRVKSNAVEHEVLLNR